MHYSQGQRKDYYNRPHPGTPRPDTNELKSNEDSKTLERPSKRIHKSNANGGKLTSSRNQQCPLQMENPTKFLVWVKNEPFDFGILSPLPCPKIGINVLRKIAEYCRDKPGHYPELSLNQWSHICKYKIQLPNANLCTAYFRVFDIISRPVSDWTCNNSKSTNYGQIKECLSSPITDESVNEGRDAKFYKMLHQGYDEGDDFNANTLKFMLFLYIQHFRRLHKKFSMSKNAGNEPWPIFLEHSNNNHSGTHVVTPEQRHAEFVTANLSDMIDFLMILQTSRDLFSNFSDDSENRRKRLEKADSHKYRKVESNSEPVIAIANRIPVSIIKALTLILGASSITQDAEFEYLDDIFAIPEIASQVNFNSSDSTVDKERLIKWLMGNLSVNPWGPSSVTIPQVPIPLMTGICIGDDGESSTESTKKDVFMKNKIYWNAQCPPKAWVSISNVVKQTLLLDTLEPLSSIKISRCSDSNIYIPGMHNSIIIQKCTGLNLNVGVVTKVVKIVDCSNITLSGVGRFFNINDTVSSTFHLLTPTSPIICGNKNHKIQLTPYNTSYPDLGIHMKNAGFCPKFQKWNKPLELSSDGYPNDYSLCDSSIILHQPERFSLTAFPFKAADATETTSSSSTLLLPGILPGPYQRQVNSTAKIVEKVKKEVQTRLVDESESTYSAEENLNLIYKITLLRFKKWLKDTGNYEQIMGLLSLQKSLEQKFSTPVLLSNQYDLACISKYLKKFFNVVNDRGSNRIRSTSPLYYGVRIKHHARNEEGNGRNLNESNETLSSKMEPTVGESMPVFINGAGESLVLRNCSKEKRLSIRFKNMSCD